MEVRGSSIDHCSEGNGSKGLVGDGNEVEGEGNDDDGQGEDGAGENLRGGGGGVGCDV